VRILEIAPPWFSIPPAGYGGIEWIVALLADGLVEAGHDVTLLASGGSVTLARLEPVYDAPPSLRIGDPWYETRHVVACGVTTSTWSMTTPAPSGRRWVRCSTDRRWSTRCTGRGRRKSARCTRCWPPGSTSWPSATTRPAGRPPR